MQHASRLFALTLAVLLPSLASAENILKLEDGVQLFAINGKEVAESTHFLATENEHRLPDGINQIVVSYIAEIKNGSSYELEDSAPAVIRFAATEQQISIAAPPILSASDMERFNQKQNWRLTTSDHQSLQYSASVLPLKGLRLAVNYERELREFNQTQSDAAVLPNLNHLAPTEVSNPSHAEDVIILKMLQHWYQLASPETRRTFIASVQ